MANKTLKWSDASTWNGSVPNDNTKVKIPKNTTIVLDVPDVDVKNITVEGTLIFQDRDINLDTDSILVKGGKLQIGTAQNPFKSEATINLEDSRSVSQGDAMGVNYIGVMGGGEIELHGASGNKTSWTQLSQTAKAGSQSINLAKGNVGWQPGDKIVLASTSIDPREAEELTVTKVQGNTVFFKEALQYDHYGKQHNYSGKTIDMRAEVGLLNRNITIQGDVSSSEDQIGGHMMIMQSGKAKIDGVEFNRMGQLGEEGRYPVHWHEVGNGSGQYIKNSTVRDSYHRGIVTHGTSNVRVENNVAYDIMSHGFVVSENGRETGNVYRNNLGIFNKGLTGDQFAFGRSRRGGDFESTQQEHRPGMFWMTNLNNTITGNHAAGSWFGNGFLFSKPDYRSWVDMSRQAQKNSDQKLGSFKDNLAHSTFWDKSDNLGFYGTSTRGWGVFFDDLSKKFPDVKAVIEDFSAYKTQLGGAWIENGSEIKDSIITDSDTGVFLADNGVVEDSVIVGQTPNTTGTTKTINVATRKRRQPRQDIAFDFSEPVHSHGGIFNIPQINAIENGARVEDVKFHNLPVGIFLNDLKKVDDGKFTVKNIDTIDTKYSLGFDSDARDGGVRDVDGSISGKANSIIQATDFYQPAGSIKGDKGFEWDYDF